MADYVGDFDLTETATVPFNTFDSNDPSNSVTVTALVAGDVYVHKDGIEGAPAGITISLNVGAVNGNHWVKLDLSDTTDAGFYAAGSRYQVRIEGADVDGGNINAWVGTLSIGCLLRPTAAGRTLDVNATGEAGLDLDNTSGTLAAAQIAADAITAAKVAGDVHAEAADAVWDEVLTGGTHNVVNSAGRRLRQIQEAGGYSGGAIYIDTVNGTAGTTDFENGVDSFPVDNIADANTIAASLGISRFRVAPGSSITFAATQANQMFEGSSWVLALGSQSIDGSTFIGATVSGVGTNTSGRQYFVDCNMGAVTLPGDTHCIGCAIAGTQTIGESGDYFWDACHSSVAGAATPTLDINSVANVNINWRHYSGGLEVANAVATTTMSYEADGQLVIAATCTSLTVSIRGNCSLTDSGTTSSITDDARITEGQNIGIDWGNVANQTGTVDLDNTSLNLVYFLDAYVNNGGLERAHGFLVDGATIDAVTSQTVFTLDNGPPDDDALVGGAMMITDQATPAQRSARLIIAYTGATKEVTLASAPTFMVATGDLVDVRADPLTLRATEVRLAELDAANLPAGVDAIPALLPSALIGGRMDANVGAISGSTAAADNLEESAEAIITGTAQTGTLSTTVMTSDLSGYLDDELIGRTIIWKSGTADGQASDITDYAAASGTVTYTAITTAPANGDLFVIV